MKVLVTGASGFLGHHTITTLLKHGINVVATCPHEKSIAHKPWRHLVEFHPYTLSDTEAISTNLFNYFGKPDALIHLAWKGLPNYTNTAHIEDNFLQHYYFLKNLIENGLNNLTIAGTCLEYGMQEGELVETMPYRSENPYALCKNMLRESLQFLQTELDFSLKWVRLFYMYGEGQSPKSIIPQLEKALMEGKTSFPMSPGDQQRDYLSVQAVSENMLNIALQKEVTGIINCCSGQPVSVKQFIETYLETTQRQIKLETGVYPYATYEPMHFWGSTEKLNQITPYESH